MHVKDIAEALPSGRNQKNVLHKKGGLETIPKSLPVCFAEVWRRRASSEPAHRRERATLEAVAANIPTAAASITGSAAAAVYLGALIVSVDRLVQTKKPKKQIADPSEDTVQNLSKGQRKLRKQKRLQAERSISDMPTSDVPRQTVPLQKAEGMNVDSNSEMHDAAPREESNDANTDAGLLASLLYLISSAIKGCSPAVLKTKSDQILDVVMSAMVWAAGYSPANRHVGSILASVLSVLDSSSWSKPAIQRSYLCLLQATMDMDGKCRRRAREALQMLMCCPRSSIVRPKTSLATSTHFVEELKATLQERDNAINASKNLAPPAAVHLMTSIEQFSVYLQAHDAARVAKHLIVVASTSPESVSAFALLALWAIFKHKPDEVEVVDSVETFNGFLPCKDIAKLLTALLRMDAPHETCYDWNIVFSRCVCDGSIAHADGFAHAPPSVDFVLNPATKLCEMLRQSSGDRSTMSAVTLCLQKLLSHRWWRKQSNIIVALGQFTDVSQRITWPSTVPMLRRYLEQDMTSGNLNAQNEIVELAKALLSHREEAHRDKDEKRKSMAEALLSAIVRSGGTSTLLRIQGIQYNQDTHVSNAWMLPILQENLRGSCLSLFFRDVRPVADKLEGARKKCEKQARAVEAKNIDIYISQLWSLFPGFCTHPTDLSEEGLLSATFEAIHYLITVERDAFSMCNTGAASLRQLSISIKDMSKADSTFQSLSSSFVSRLKKLFPVILNVAERTSDERRSPLLQAVTISCQASENTKCASSLLKRTLRRLLELQLELPDTNKSENDMNDKRRGTILRAQHASADLAIAIADSKILSPETTEITLLEKAVSSFLSDPKESALQKKAYRCASLLFVMQKTSNSYEDVIAFVERIASSARTVAPGAKAARLALVIALINYHIQLQATEERSRYLQGINDGYLSEIILGTRDVSEKTRSSAFACLNALARGWNTCYAGNDMTGLQQFFVAVAAGLGGKSVSMLSATLTSLGSLIYDFRGEAAANDALAETVDYLFASAQGEGDDIMQSEQDVSRSSGAGTVVMEPGPVAILLRHSAAEVQKAALGMVKIATKALVEPFTKKRLTRILPGIVPGLIHVAAHSRKQETRLRVRIILERLLRKCGRSELETNFPSEHAKLLAAVRKKFSRELVRKHAKKERRAQAAGSQKNSNDFEKRPDHFYSDDESSIDSRDSDIEKEMLDGDDLLKTPTSNADGDTNKNHGMQQDAPDGKPSSRKNDDVKYTDDDKPIFVESDDESGQAEVGSIVGDSSDGEAESSRDLKRYQPTGKRKSSVSREREGKGKRLKGSLGEEYRGKRGHGDVKRPGRPEPFAYVPLGKTGVSSSGKSRLVGKKKRPAPSRKATNSAGPKQTVRRRGGRR